MKFAFVGKWGFQPIPGGFGISSFRLTDTGLEKIGTYLPQIHVGQVTCDRRRNVLYAVDETAQQPEFHGHGGGGAVYAIKIHSDGSLSEIDHQYAFGNLTSYCCLNEDGTKLIVTNHGDQSHALKVTKDEQGVHMEIVETDSATVLYPVAEDGAILPPCDFFEHMANRPIGEERIPHLHSVVRAPLCERFIVCDKGCDAVYMFRIEDNSLVLTDTLEGMQDSAPRYACFHTALPVFYYNEERQPYLNVVSYENDRLIRIQRVLSMTEQQAAENPASASDICIRSDGKVLYHVQRGSNIISVFSVDEKGMLTLVQTVHFEGTDNRGAGARGMTLSEDEQTLWVCVVADGQILRYTLCENGTLQEETLTVFEETGAANITFAEVYE